jgi:hypothetical protein
MKLKRLILVLGLLIATNNLFGQTNNSPKKLLQGFGHRISEPRNFQQTGQSGGGC